MKVKKRQWYSGCCHQDLYQAEEDEELPDYNKVWDTELEALNDIKKYEFTCNGKRDEEVYKEIEERIKHLTI